MINSNELRIGNWVNSENGFIQIDSIDPDCGVNQYLNTSSRTRWIAIEEIDPIPLTPEILEKAGFVMDEDLGDMQYYQIKGQKRGYGICFNHDDLQFYKFNSSGITLLIHDELYFQYLHQLQNLYFSLTGQELEVNFISSMSKS